MEKVPCNPDPSQTLVRKDSHVRLNLSQTSDHVRRSPLTFLERQQKLVYGRSSAKFQYDVSLAFRVSTGVLLAGLLQIRRDVSSNGSTWLFLPSFYFLGGMSYAAIMVIFAAGRNVGQSLRLSWQSFCGVLLALLFNAALFSVLPLTQGALREVTLEVDQSNYFVSETDFYTFLPFSILFTFVVMMSSVGIDTKKFAVGINAYFILTLINPSDPYDSNILKNPQNEFYGVTNILQNFFVYFLIGIFGSFLGVLTMLLPYPLFAMSQLKVEAKLAEDDVTTMMNTVVDAYLVKHKTKAHLSYVKLQMSQLITKAKRRLRMMDKLMEDCWWEDCFGIQHLVRFDKRSMVEYIRLYRTLLKNIRGLRMALQSKHHDPDLHTRVLWKIATLIYRVQKASVDVLAELSRQVLGASGAAINVDTMKLEGLLVTLLQSYQDTMVEIMQVRQGHKEVNVSFLESTLSLNSFVFHMIGWSESLVCFGAVFNRQRKTSSVPAMSLKSHLVSFFSTEKMPIKIRLRSSIKVTLAVHCAMFASVYMYGYSETATITVAYVMGIRLGGTFRTATNRVIGIMLGTVFPSVVKYFICEFNPTWSTVFTRLSLFVWTQCSMYGYYVGGPFSYAGLVSAFIAAQTLLNDRCIAYAGTNPRTPFSELVQTSMGVLLFVLVELLFKPQSAITLLRRNIRVTMKHLQCAFEIYYDHHAPSQHEHGSPAQVASLAEARALLNKHIPALIQSQMELLVEANLEPLLWRPDFSTLKYKQVTELCQDLLFHLSLWDTIVVWQQRRHEGNTVGLTSEEADETWMYNSTKFEYSLHQSFAALQTLFDEAHLLDTPKDTLHFLHMNEVFRQVDTNGDGTLNEAEISCMLLKLLKHSHHLEEGELKRSVQQFMEIVGKDRHGKITREEFVHAVELGITFHVEEDLTDHASLTRALSGLSDHAPLTKQLSNRSYTDRSYLPNLSEVLTTLDLEEASMDVLHAFISWVGDNSRYERIRAEDLLVVNCFVAGAMGLASDCKRLNRVLVSD